MGLFKNAAKDAKKIHEEFQYPIIRASWDAFTRAQKSGFEHTHQSATPAWFALFSVQNYKGKWSKFDKDEIHLLESFTQIQNSYEQILKVLNKNKDNQQLAEYILSTHPNLNEVVPTEFNNKEQIISYLIGVTDQYKTALHGFFETHQKDILKTIDKIKMDIVKNEDQEKMGATEQPNKTGEESEN